MYLHFAYIKFKVSSLEKCSQCLNTGFGSFTLRSCKSAILWHLNVSVISAGNDTTEKLENMISNF